MWMSSFYRSTNHRQVLSRAGFPQGSIAGPVLFQLAVLLLAGAVSAGDYTKGVHQEARALPASTGALVADTTVTHPYALREYKGPRL